MIQYVFWPDVHDSSRMQSQPFLQAAPRETHTRQFDKGCKLCEQKNTSPSHFQFERWIVTPSRNARNVPQAFANASKEKNANHRPIPQLGRTRKRWAAILYIVVSASTHKCLHCVRKKIVNWSVEGLYSSAESRQWKPCSQHSSNRPGAQQ